MSAHVPRGFAELPIIKRYEADLAQARARIAELEQGYNCAMCAEQDALDRAAAVAAPGRSTRRTSNRISSTCRG